MGLEAATYNHVQGDVQHFVTPLRQPCDSPKGPHPGGMIRAHAGAVRSREGVKGGRSDFSVRLSGLATCIAGEMNSNINSSSVRQMKELNSFDSDEETRQ